jgi:hypothetical protein
MLTEGSAGHVERWSWAGDEGEEQSRVELIGGDLQAWTGETEEGNGCGEEWGCSWVAFMGQEGGEAAGRVLEIKGLQEGNGGAPVLGEERRGELGAGRARWGGVVRFHRRWRLEVEERVAGR